MNKWLIMGFMPLFLVLNSCIQQLAGTDNGSETSNGITGMVVDSTNKPIPGLAVWLRSHDFIPGKENALQKKTRTDEKGTFRFEELTPAEYILEIKKDFTSARAQFFSHQGGYQEFGKLKLAPTGGITGTVLDNECKKKECVIYFQGLNETIPVDSGGNFTALNIPSNDYSMVLLTPSQTYEPKEPVSIKPGLVSDIIVSESKSITHNDYKEFDLKQVDKVNNFLLNQFGQDFSGLHSVANFTSGDITKLDLSNMGMNFLHPSIGQCKSLDTLILNHNPLKSLPSEIWKLHSLEVLRIKNCSLSSLSQEIENMSELQILDFTQNTIQEIPPAVFTLNHLKVLNIQQNPIEYLSDSLGLLTNLTSIGMAWCKITTLPNSIGNLSSLTQIWAANNNIEFLPETIGELKNLLTIQLDGNNLSALPNSFGNLTQMKNLYLPNNQITHLPQSITNLQSIERMFIKENSICNPTQEVKQWLDQNGETDWAARQNGC